MDRDVLRRIAQFAFSTGGTILLLFGLSTLGLLFVMIATLVARQPQ